MWPKFSTSTGKNLWNSLAFSRKIITSTGFYRCCALDAPAPVVVKFGLPFMCFFRVIPYGGEKHINKIPPKIPGQSRENFVYVFFLYVFFSLPKNSVLR